MEIRIENSENKILKVGDFVVNREGDFCMVIKIYHFARYEYSIKRIDIDKGYMITEDSLEELTKKALCCGMLIYPKDEYELILRKRD